MAKGLEDFTYHCHFPFITWSFEAIAGGSGDDHLKNGK
jgi:hypothetical protein